MRQGTSGLKSTSRGRGCAQRLAAGLLMWSTATVPAAAQNANAKDADVLSYEVLANVDLLTEFHTKKPTHFIVTQEPTIQNDVPGDLHFCFSSDGKAICPKEAIHSCDLLGENPTCADLDTFVYLGQRQYIDPLAYNYFQSASVFHSDDGSGTNLLVVIAGRTYVTGSAKGAIIWAYRRESDNFEQIFSGVRSANTNGEARFVSNGPLAGAVITDETTSRWPYRYRVTVYRLTSSGHYAEDLNYLGNTKYNDGNPLAVIDSEMVEIERRLHLWKEGDPLPHPLYMPAFCTSVRLARDGTEWCQSSPRNDNAGPILR